MLSSSDVVEPSSEPHMWADEPELISDKPNSAMAPETVDGDMDMMDVSEPVAGRCQPALHAPPDVVSSPFQAGSAVPSVTGRIPTPIHCSFAAQVRGNSWNGTCGNVGQGDALATTPEEPNAAAFQSNGLVDVTIQRLSIMGPDAVPRVLGGGATTALAAADWSMVENRRLPSPISECGGEDSVESPNMVHESGAQSGGPMSHLTHAHPLLAGLPPRASPGPREGTPASENANANVNAMDIESSAAPSSKKGHTRSKHTLNSWTALQPGMKRSFSIGYRADCEKCRMKVPGHFNHIIIS